MVDYSFVRFDCPSIAFLFTHLGCLLESVKEGCLDWVSLFVREDYPYEPILSFLFPLVSHSAKVARSLKMSEVRSSDLEIGLSLSDNHVISEATSSSTPYRAWNISCSLTGKDEQQIRDRFQFLNSVKIRILSDGEIACHSYADEVCFYEADVFISLFIPLLGNFFLICTLLWHY